MGHRLSKIYTRTGDDGTTGLGDGSRAPKDSPRVRAMGEVDELNSAIGVLLNEKLPAGMGELLADVQHALFDLGGELSIPGGTLMRDASVTRLEHAIDYFNDPLPPLKEFILPGGSRAASLCHLARAVCRRAERSVIALSATESVNRASLLFLNRLSDLLFVMARVAARAAGGSEVLWKKDGFASS
jgi:cob(I)alamin adenosyltransferase